MATLIKDIDKKAYRKCLLRGIRELKENDLFPLLIKKHDSLYEFEKKYHKSSVGEAIIKLIWDTSFGRSYTAFPFPGDVVRVLSSKLVVSFADSLMNDKETEKYGLEIMIAEFSFLDAVTKRNGYNYWPMFTPEHIKQYLADIFFKRKIHLQQKIKNMRHLIKFMEVTQNGNEN